MKLDKQKIEKISNDIHVELQSLAVKHGVSIRTRGGSFNDSNATLKLEIATVGEDGAVLSKERTDFKKHARDFGLRPDHLDSLFEYNGKEMKIVGLKTKARKYPILAEQPDGKRYAFPATMVIRRLAALGKV